MKTLILSILFITIFTLFYPANIHAAEIEKMGMHVLNVDELDEAKKMLVTDETKNSWHYLTIPYTQADVQKSEQWQRFFDNAKEKKIIPIVRLTSRFENNAWVVPNRKELTEQITTLSRLDWPTDRQYLVVFNEVNHSKEWEGRIDPEEYARIFRFASNWAHAEDDKFIVLPAAMDLAAPNGKDTMEAFTYLDKMYSYDKDIFSYADAWNSHSYPNPGFSSSPERTGKNSLRGFEHELAYLKEKTDTDFEVLITETGWEENNATRRHLFSYYKYAMQHIWSDDQVIAVTPFILKGDPGPFSGFSFIDKENQPTLQYQALKAAMQEPLSSL